LNTGPDALADVAIDPTQPTVMIEDILGKLGKVCAELLIMDTCQATVMLVDILDMSSWGR
jgi:hypothetical protein